MTEITTFPSEAQIPAACIQVELPSSVVSVGPSTQSHSTQKERADIATHVLVIFCLICHSNIPVPFHPIKEIVIESKYQLICFEARVTL